MSTHYFSAHRKQDWEDRGLQYAELHELLRACQIVVISTPTNVKAIDAEQFGLLPPNSILVQASLGTPFDRDAFLEWVAKDGNYAVFDNGAGEDNTKIYRTLPRVILSETSSGNTYETRERLGQKVVENLKAYLTK